MSRLFSIVIPSYNQGRFLRACLESVLAQEGVPFEVLVCDGGSTDDSGAIIEEYAPRLAYHRSRPDAGQAAALAEGLARARGDLLGWVNSDDLLLPGALAAAAAGFARHPRASMLYGDAVWIDAAGRVIGVRRELDFDWRMFAFGYCYLVQPATFFTADAYARAGGVDPHLRTCMDYDLWHRLARAGEVAHLSRFLAAARRHAQTKTSRLQAVFRREEDLLRRRYLHCPRVSFFPRHLYQRLRRVCLRLRTGGYRSLARWELERLGLESA